MVRLNCCSHCICIYLSLFSQLHRLDWILYFPLETLITILILFCVLQCWGLSPGLWACSTTELQHPPPSYFLLNIKSIPLDVSLRGQRPNFFIFPLQSVAQCLLCNGCQVILVELSWFNFVSAFPRAHLSHLGLQLWIFNIRT